MDPRRLASARRVGRGRPLEFVRLDAATEALPGPFDVVFCTDVLEHVSDWRRLLRHAVSALAPGGALFLSLHNARHPSVVLSEPHYGLAGLVLLPPEEAAACWGRVRAVLGSALDYEVTSWPLYPDIAALCQGLGLAVTPWVDCASAYDPAFWAAPATDVATVAARASVELARLGIPEADGRRLQAAIGGYEAEAAQAFGRAARADADAAARVDYYITYHAQPLNLLLRRA